MLWRRILFFVSLLGLIACLGAALTASERDVIYRGSDLWETAENGNTYLDFSDNPIPGGFFCSGSAPFAERIQFRGEPLATEPAGAFARTDTIVERLDDAEFDEQGRASTRIQIRALSLVSRDAIQTSCGLFRVTVGLDGEQPVTEMTIVRDGPIGGYFIVPIDLNVRLSFWPVSQGSDFRESLQNEDRGMRIFRPLQLVQPFHLQSDPRAGWTSFPPEGGLRHEADVLVDLDADGTPETSLPGTSNFAAGSWDRDGVPVMSNVYLSSGLGTVSAVLHAHHDVLQARAREKGNKAKR